MKKTLTLQGLAAKLGVSEIAVRQLRERSPQALPIPYATRPLAWRAEEVEHWIVEQQRSLEAVT